MTQVHSSTKSRTFTHLTEIERGQIAAYLEEGLSIREIARRMGRNASTISREKQRGTVQQMDTNRKTYTKYFPDTGLHVYVTNRKKCISEPKMEKAAAFIRYAEEKILKKKWSPDVATGYAKVHDLFDYIPSTKTVYNWIDVGLLKVRNIDLELKLRRSTKKKTNRKHKKLLGKSIDERPESVDTREEIGHWEIDTVVGQRSKDEVLLTLTERATRHEIIRKIKGKQAPEVTKALNSLFEDAPELRVTFKSITADNGSEFSELAEWGKENKIDTYFAHPYSSWERGTNERHNGLIRRFIKKGSPMNIYSNAYITQVEHWLNDLPRKILNYQTPAGAFAAFLDKVA